MVAAPATAKAPVPARGTRVRVARRLPRSAHNFATHGDCRSVRSIVTVSSEDKMADQLAVHPDNCRAEANVHRGEYETNIIQANVERCVCILWCYEYGAEPHAGLLIEVNPKRPFSAVARAAYQAAAVTAFQNEKAQRLNQNQPGTVAETENHHVRVCALSLVSLFDPLVSLFAWS